MFTQAKLASVGLIAMLFVGCASVPMAPKDQSAKMKAFAAPADGKSGLYIYRTAGVGAALKKDIWVNDKCVGQSAQNVFFYEEVDGNKEHKVSTESEFSPNNLMVNAESGKNYFIQQYIKMGVFVGGANLTLVGEEEGKRAVSTLEMAEKGTCSK